MEESKESGELILLSYGFPVIHECCPFEVSEEEIIELESALRFRLTPSKKRLEKIFPKAVGMLKICSKSNDPLIYWEPKNVQKYWHEKHNNLVADNPICKVYFGEVLEMDYKKGYNEALCKICETGKKQKFKTYFDLEKKEFVSMHRGYIAEKLSD